MRIREAHASEAQAIGALHRAAFGDEGAEVSALALALMADASARPLLVLIAESDMGMLGSVIFSAVHVPGLTSGPCYILAPLAVAPAVQGQGIKSRLVEAGIAALQARGCELLFVLGDPRDYSRFGFSAAHHVRAPFELPYPDAWMCLSLGQVAIAAVQGQLRCADTLNQPQHW